MSHDFLPKPLLLGAKVELELHGSGSHVPVTYYTCHIVCQVFLLHTFLALTYEKERGSACVFCQPAKAVGAERIGSSKTNHGKANKLDP